MGEIINNGFRLDRRFNKNKRYVRFIFFIALGLLVRMEQMKNQVLNYRRVIVVDDNRVDLFLNTLMVKKLDITDEVVSFEKPLEALGYLRTLATKRTDKILLLLDLNMPEISGFEFLEALPPIIGQLECFDVLIVTSSIACEDRDKAYKNPLVNDFLIKPLRLEELNNSIGLQSKEVGSQMS